MSADAPFLLGGEPAVDGTEDSGRGRGISCRKFLSFEGFEPALKQRESECIYRYANLLLPRTLRLPQCSLVLGPLSPLYPSALTDGDEMSVLLTRPSFLTR